MKAKTQTGLNALVATGLNIFLVILMPFMWYIDVSGTKVNFSISDVLLILVGILLLFNIKELFINKRWLVIVYFASLLFSLALSQFAGKFNDGFEHVPNSVMLLEMIKTAVVAVYFTGAFIFVNENNFKLTLITMSLGSIPVMFVGFYAYLYRMLDRDFFIDKYALDTFRFRGTFEDPNLCALYFITIFFVSIYCFKIVKSLLLRCIIATVSVLSVVAIVLTLSRGGWLAFAGAIIVFLLFNIKYIKKETVLIVLTVVFMLLAALNTDYILQQGKITNLVIDRVHETTLLDTDDINRVQLMKAAVQMGNDNFLVGVGKGSFPLNSDKYLGEDSIAYKRQYIPHNTLLGFYSQQGIIGLLLFIALPGFLLYLLIKSKHRQKAYFIALFSTVFIHSMTINTENIRFVWYALGIMLAAEIKNLQPEFSPEVVIKKRSFTVAAGLLACAIMIGYAGLSTKMAVNIRIANGNAYHKNIDVPEPGVYVLSFDIQTNSHVHSVEVYEEDNLLKSMQFKGANGLVCEKISAENQIKVVFRSNDDGWMKVNNAYIQKESTKIPVYNYLLVPDSMQHWLNNQRLLAYREEPSFKKEVDSSGIQLRAIPLTHTTVTRYSNLTHVFAFQYHCNESIDKNYQLDLLMEYGSITSLLPNETQRNNWTHRFTLSPSTSKWEKGNEYTPKTYKLFSSLDFHLYGRYYDYQNKVFEQEAYFPIDYNIKYENQEILPPDELKWLTPRYSKDKENNIQLTSNGWVESERTALEPGVHTIIFKAQGSFLEEFSKIRLRDSYLNEIATLTLDDSMKEYKVEYSTDKFENGISFIFELINYKSEKDVGDRRVLLSENFFVE